MQSPFPPPPPPSPSPPFYSEPSRRVPFPEPESQQQWPFRQPWPPGPQQQQQQQQQQHQQPWQQQQPWQPGQWQQQQQQQQRQPWQQNQQQQQGAWQWQQQQQHQKQQEDAFASAELGKRVQHLQRRRPPLTEILLYGGLIAVAAALVGYALTKYVVVPRLARDCRIGSWSAWTGCENTSCNGVGVRSRAIEREAAFGGLQCFADDLVQVAPCADLNACDARDCQYGAVQTLTSCSAAACFDPSSGACQQGSGEQVLYTPITRDALSGGRPCDWAQVLAITPCNVESECSGSSGPPQDCSMSDWSSFSACPDPGALCALPGAPPWWTFAYRTSAVPASGGGLPCNPLDMLRSETCPQNTCTWCSLSWGSDAPWTDPTSGWSNPTFPCGPATIFKEADVIYAGDLPCLAQSVSAVSLGACATGAFDALENAVCTGYDALVPCAGAQFSGAHLPQVLWGLFQGRTPQGGALENLGGGEFQAAAGADWLAMPPQLAQNAVPPPDANSDYRAVCLMACAEMASCSGVLWNETAGSGQMLINTVSTAAATCTGLGAAPPTPEPYFLTLDAATLAAEIVAAQGDFVDNADSNIGAYSGGSGGDYAAPAAVALRLVGSWGFTVATAAQVLGARVSGLTIHDGGLTADGGAMGFDGAQTCTVLSHQGTLQRADALVLALASPPFVLATASAEQAADVLLSLEAEVADKQAAVVAATAQVAAAAGAPGGGTSTASIVARAHLTAATALLASAEQVQAAAQAAYGTAAADAAALGAATVHGVWVYGPKPPLPIEALSLYSPLAPPLRDKYTVQPASVHAWSLVSQPSVQETPEVFLLIPTAAALGLAYSQTLQSGGIGNGGDGGGDAVTVLWDLVHAAGYVPAAATDVAAAVAAGMTPVDTHAYRGLVQPQPTDWSSVSVAGPGGVAVYPRTSARVYALPSFTALAAASVAANDTAVFAAYVASNLSAATAAYNAAYAASLSFGGLGGIGSDVWALESQMFLAQQESATAAAAAASAASALAALNVVSSANLAASAWASPAGLSAAGVGAWVWGIKPPSAAAALAALPSFKVPAFSNPSARGLAGQPQWSRYASTTPLPSSGVGSSAGSGLPGGQGPGGALQTAYVWNPVSTNCERIVWPMVGAACLEVCDAGTARPEPFGHGFQGAQPVLDRGTFAATVFPLANGQLSCPITPSVMAASGQCAPDADGLWTSGSCPLSQDCEYQPWSEAGVWGMCDAQCSAVSGGGGVRTRVRAITQHAAFLGTPCVAAELTETAACNSNASGNGGGGGMSCAPPPTTASPALPALAAATLDLCAQACDAQTAAAAAYGSGNGHGNGNGSGAAGPCTAFEYDAGVGACQLFVLPGGIDALLYDGLCSASDVKSMYAPPCSSAGDCSLTAWAPLSTCGACGVPYAYQTRSVVHGAARGGRPCTDFALFASTSCGAVQSCESLPCLYGPWPTTQPSSSPSDVSACLKYLAEPTLFQDSWDPTYATAWLQLQQHGGVSRLSDVSNVAANLVPSAGPGSGPGSGGSGGASGLTWDLAQALNAQVLTSQGAAPTCIQTFPTLVDSQIALALEPPVDPYWRGDTFAFSSQTDAADAQHPWAWGVLSNGGPQTFLAQFTAAVGATSIQVLVQELSVSGWTLATAAQVENVAARGATAPASMACLVGNADGSSPPTSMTTAVNGGSLTVAAATGVPLSALFGAWLVGPKPVQNTLAPFFAPLPFFSTSVNSSWNVPLLGATAWPGQHPLVRPCIFDGGSACGSTSQLGVRVPSSGLPSTPDAVGAWCWGNGFDGFVFDGAPNGTQNGSCFMLDATAPGQTLANVLALSSTSVPWTSAQAQGSGGGGISAASGADTYVFNPTRALGFRGAVPTFATASSSVGAGVGIVGSPQAVLLSCSTLGFDGAVYSAGAGGGAGAGAGAGAGTCIHNAAGLGAPVDPSQYTAVAGSDTYWFRGAVEPLGGVGALGGSGGVGGSEVGASAERGWVRLPGTILPYEWIENYTVLNAPAPSEAALAAYCAASGADGAYFHVGSGTGSCFTLGVSVAEAATSALVDTSKVMWLFSVGTAPQLCPQGIDAGWAATASARLAAPGADARLLYSASAWACPSLCPAVEHFCAWSPCDATCSSSAQAGGRTMVRAVTQYALSDTAYACDPLELLAQTGCATALPPCNADCPMGSTDPIHPTTCNSGVTVTVGGVAQPQGTCLPSGDCACAAGFTSYNCDKQCTVSSNGLVCGGPTHGECLPSGACYCHGGWYGAACDEFPAVMLGNSALVAALGNADFGGAAGVAPPAGTPSYGYGSADAAGVPTSGACTDDGPGGLGRAACDLCVPYVPSTAVNWVPPKYLNVMYVAPQQSQQSAPIGSFADVCTHFWSGNDGASQTLGTKFANTPLAPAVASMWAFIKAQ